MTTVSGQTTVQPKDVSRVTIRFAGDSGDGMQLVGTHFSNASAFVGNDVATLPDFPAEIRAPQGSVPGVSAFQISFANEDIYTPGDCPDVLVAMNPAALKANLIDLPKGGTIIVNTDAFNGVNLKKAGYEESPLDNNSLEGYQVFEVPITAMNKRALEEMSLTATEVDRCKNFFALGLTYWLYSRPLNSTVKQLEKRFASKPQLLAANVATLKAGHAFGETAEVFSVRYTVRSAPLKAGTYRSIAGNTATALGFITAARLAERPLFLASYPITPASDVLHELARYKHYDVRTFQAEDEIAAVGAAIGGAFGGSLALTSTSGPGIALKAEAIGMAVMMELPLVIINVQRAGPSTGMPTKPEQADLWQAMYGRNGECPAVVVAPATPSDCFAVAIEAARIAIEHMVPVFFLSDGYLGNGSEPWHIPDVSDFSPITAPIIGESVAPFEPYARDKKYVRPWALPGTPGLEHRLGSLEKQNLSGNVSYDPDNHELMTELRAKKVEAIADTFAPLKVYGPDDGEVLVVGWGSTYGAIRSAVARKQDAGVAVAHVHLRHINPLPNDLGTIMSRYKHVLVPELNRGQLELILRARYLIDTHGLHKVRGQPFRIAEISDAIDQVRAGKRLGQGMGN